MKTEEEVRLHALLSFDMKTIRSWAREYGVRLPRDEEKCILKIHALRTQARMGVPLDERILSSKWLMKVCSKEEIKKLKADVHEGGSVQLEFV